MSHSDNQHLIDTIIDEKLHEHIKTKLDIDIRNMNQEVYQRLKLRSRLPVASYQSRCEILNNSRIRDNFGKPVVKKPKAASFKKNLKRHNYQVIQNTTDITKQPGKEKSVTCHEYDDFAPIFRNPLDITQSLYEPHNIEHMWVPYDIPREAAMRLKKHLNYIVQLGIKERAAYMDQITEVRHVYEKDTENNACDTALIGHKGLFTKRFTPAFTVIGVYSGAFLRNDIDFAALSEHYDPADMSDYLFRIAEDYKWPKISAFKLGNRLTIANAATNYENGLEEGMNDVEHRRTIIPVYGKSGECPFPDIHNKTECPDVLFLVTCRDMPPQTQCLYDYGPIYWANNDK